MPRPSRHRDVAPGDLLVQLDVPKRGALWRIGDVMCDYCGEHHPSGQIRVVADEMRSLGMSESLIDRFEAWVEGAASDPQFPRHVSRMEHWDNVGLELWALTIFE